MPLTDARPGVKKSLVLVPETSWISGRTSIYFHPMSGGQVKNSMLVYFSLTRTSYLVTGQVKILMYLPGGQVKIFRFFYPCRHTSSNWLQGDVASQSVATCMGPVAVSPRNLTLSDIFLWWSVMLQVIADCMPGSCKYKNPWKWGFRRCWRANQFRRLSVHLVCTPVADSWDWTCDGSLQAVGVCRAWGSTFVGINLVSEEVMSWQAKGINTGLDILLI